MHKVFRYGLVFLGFVVLALIRFRESDLFYDPLIEFFYGDYQYLELPEVDWGKYILNLLGRFLVNTIVSLAIVWLIFPRRGTLTFAALLYVVLVVVVLPAFVYQWHHSETGNYFLLFALRRFLIQPLFIGILIPAFYYYYKVKS